jgi:hypothetical protein
MTDQIGRQRSQQVVPASAERNSIAKFRPSTIAAFLQRAAERGKPVRFLHLHPGLFVPDPECERYLVTGHPNGWLRKRVAGPAQQPTIEIIKFGVTSESSRTHRPP